MANYFKLVYFVPSDDLDKTKEALFRSGAGRYQNYDRACWQSLGTGQFRPLEGANPHRGVKDEVLFLEEWRVELLCSESKLSAALEALRQAHPYEEPAIDVYALVNLH